jgi:hypothetical protein
MPVDPYAFGRAYNNQLAIGRQGRLDTQNAQQQQIDNARQERVMQMQEDQYGLQRQQFEAQQQAAQQQMQQQDIQRAAAVGRQALRLGEQNEGLARQFLKRSVPVYQKSIAAVADDYSDLVDDNVPWEQLKSHLQSLAAFDQPEDAEQPSSVREWQYYNALTPEEQQAYREMKRAQNPYTAAEFGGARGAFNKNTGKFEAFTTPEQEAAYAATESGAKAGASERAKTMVEKQTDLPRLEQNTADAIAVIDKLYKAPGLPHILGWYSKAPIVPGTDQAAADALAKQIQGQTFLQAFTSLKGGGAITEVEGSKAEAAIGRLQRSQSFKDYRAALKELKSVLTRGLERARRTAQGASQGAAPATGGIPQGWSVEVH